ncbi:nucleotide sugar dehydrogenase [Candidatus Woesearchaeota archaeon]|nr:MAG: nucleotide sugar dehydrogenase [Candidatus Woesearchaeota archaeon]
MNRWEEEATKRSPISVIGLGKAGLPLLAVIADAGIPVIGLDINEQRVQQLRNGNNPLPEEPFLSEILTRHHKHITFTTSYEDLSEATTHIIIVPLFLTEDHEPDFHNIDAVCAALAPIVKQRDLVVLETTVPLGTCSQRIIPALESGGCTVGKDFFFAYSPERIMTGKAISRYKEFPKIVGGATPACTEHARSVYTQFCTTVQPVSDCTTAEFVKLAEGLYRDVNIALANELYKVAERHGIDYWEVRAHARHAFCDLHEPGLVGGHCIPVYPWFLIKNENVPLIALAREENEKMVDYYLTKIRAVSPRGRVGLIGLSYREGVKDASFSRARTLIERLKKAGYELFGSDPLFTPAEVTKEFGIAPLTNFADMDVLVLLTKLPEYREQLAPLREKVIDIKNVLGGANHANA